MIPRAVARNCAVALGLGLAAACSSSNGPSRPVIDSFAADSPTIPAGQSTTLRWSVRDATSTSIDQGIGVVTGNSVVVSPTDTTTYTLTATGAGGTSTASAKVTVARPPVIVSFTAQPVSIPAGRSSTLSWIVGGATSLSIDQGVGDVTQKTSAIVSPTVDTTYTLSATGPGGTVTRSTSVSVHVPLLHLQYDDPIAGAGKLRLVRNPSSTANRLVLDLQVGANALTGFGVALTLPLDPAKVTFTSGTGLILNATVLDAGNSPATAAATFPTSGPLQGMLVVGVARKKLSTADGDVAFTAGATVFSIAIDMNGTPPEGVIFTGTNLGTRSRAAILNKAGAEVVSKADFAIGNLSVAL
jgi:hypothetical protein